MLTFSYLINTPPILRLQTFPILYSSSHLVAIEHASPIEQIDDMWARYALLGSPAHFLIIARH